MDRRETIKSLLVGSMAGGVVLQSCAEPEEPAAPAASESPNDGGYGRTEKEAERNQSLMNEVFFSDSELGTLATLCDIILPATANFRSASEAEVPEFIEFMAKDFPPHQLPLRGGIMWLDSFANRSFNKSFNTCSPEEQLQLIDQIAYPEEENSPMAPGIAFFALMRNLTLTGYYTTKEGLEELGYVGNTPGVWDGVPEDVLQEHGLSYDPEWIARCVNQDQRMEVAKWDDDKNLIT